MPLPMNLVHTLPDLRRALAGPKGWALVPTMGNLHAGHLALVRAAQQQGLPVVVSIFVNRLQFAPHEDFDLYPRTLAADCELLAQVGCDLVFAPSETDLYPQPQTCKVHPAPALADILEGHFRPGFFVGVCTVVMKLFACIQPTVAVFGKKDYQQLLVIEHMVAQLALPIQIVGVNTLRTEEGLALSSRNRYLSPTQLQHATTLHQTLQTLRAHVVAKPQDIDIAQAQALAHLQQQGWQPDYVCIRRRADLQVPAAHETAGHWVALAAARLGSTRLIDNLEC